MEKFFDPANLQAFALYAVPGIVTLYVRAQFTTGRLPKISEGIVAYVIVSLVYLALVIPFNPYFSHWSEYRLLGVIGPILFTFVGPALIGLALGLNIRKGWTQRILGKVGINTIHPVDSAWDFRFGSCGRCWVQVTLKDGTEWAGLFGSGSFASTDSSERDIYIEQVYSVDDEGAWVSRTSGVLLSGDQVQSIEFWPFQR